MKFMKFFSASAFALMSGLLLSQAALANNTNDPLGNFLEERFNQPEMIEPHLSSSSALVINSKTGEVLFAKNTEQQRPVASITKLITAMTIMEAGLPLDEKITITSDENLKQSGAGTRLTIGTTLTRKELLHLALMGSDNRAAHALARTYPGGSEAFVARMNRLVRGLGMRNTSFSDPSGLSQGNVSTASDLALAVRAAHKYPLIRQFSTSKGLTVLDVNGKAISYHNTNRFVNEGKWEIMLQKTGFIKAAGNCVVMHAKVGSQPLVIVLLNANGSAARASDARTIKSWLEGKPQLWL